MSMRRNNIFNMYFNPYIVPCISLYRTMVMVIWIKNRSCPHGNGLNGEPIAMGGGNNTNACQSAWSCAMNFFPSNSVGLDVNQVCLKCAFMISKKITNLVGSFVCSYGYKFCQHLICSFIHSFVRPFVWYNFSPPPSPQFCSLFIFFEGFPYTVS